MSRHASGCHDVIERYCATLFLMPREDTLNTPARATPVLRRRAAPAALMPYADVSRLLFRQHVASRRCAIVSTY